MDCASCHTPDRWVPARPDMDFDHDATAFRLDGSHATASCDRCHLGLRFDEPRVPVGDCATCHLDVHQDALGADCLSCHTTTSFNDLPAVEIHTRSAFPLTGAHLQITCESCHVDERRGAFSTLDADCISCHLPDYQRTDIIDHEARGFPSTCQQCHGTLAWQSTEAFDHAAAARGFALLGAHDRAPCASCHVMPSLEPLFHAVGQDDCTACHQTDYDREHAGTGFPTECSTCHNVDVWTDAVFDHAGLSDGFELEGRHLQIDCLACHSAPGFQVPFNPADQNDCVSCHQDDYNLEHDGTGFPTTCLECHTVDTWSGATFDHMQASGFPLLGRHVDAACSSCHVPPGKSLRFPTTDPNDCASCHQADYDTEHAGSGFPLTCLSCHTVDGWGTGTFDHVTSSGGFDLTGKHLTAACSSCHSLPGNGIPWSPADQNDCVACHQADYDREHAGTSIPTSCASCHTTDRFDGAVVDHVVASNGFDLVGAHASAPCATCHSNADGSVPWNPANQDDCVACHQTDYNSEHGGTGFPTTCLTCHVQTQWTGANFNHDAAFFPINSGKHQGKWGNNCATCHTDPGNYQVFTCLNCHEHRKSEADSEHKDVSGYVYASASCYSCHPTGRS